MFILAAPGMFPGWPPMGVPPVAPGQPPAAAAGAPTPTASAPAAPAGPSSSNLLQDASQTQVCHSKNSSIPEICSVTCFGVDRNDLFFSFFSQFHNQNVFSFQMPGFALPPPFMFPPPFMMPPFMFGESLSTRTKFPINC